MLKDTFRGASPALNERRKIVLQFSIMLVASLIAGICFVITFGISFSDSIWNNVITHFTRTNASEYGIFSLTVLALRLCMPYLLSALFMMLFCFSFINYALYDILIAANGFCIGACLMIVYVLRHCVGIFTFIGYCIISLASLLLLLFLALRASELSLKMKISSSNGRLIFRARPLMQMLLTLCTTLGAFMLLGFLHCLLLF